MNFSLFDNLLDVRVLLGLVGLLLAIIFVAYWVHAHRRRGESYRNKAQQTIQPKPAAADEKPHLNEDSEMPVNQDAPNTSYSSNDKQQR